MRLRALLMLIMFCVTNNVMAATTKKIYGYVEKVTLVDNNLVVKAKLDSGAKSASLNAIKITEVIIDDKTYLKFLVPTKKGNIAFTCEYAGRVNIKARLGESKVHSMLNSLIKRPVVKMKVELNGEVRTIYVNLTNRKHFLYPLLLGREAIKAFGGAIDPELKYTINTRKTVYISDHG